MNKRRKKRAIDIVSHDRAGPALAWFINKLVRWRGSLLIMRASNVSTRWRFAREGEHFGVSGYNKVTRVYIIAPVHMQVNCGGYASNGSPGFAFNARLKWLILCFIMFYQMFFGYYLPLIASHAPSIVPIISSVACRFCAQKAKTSDAL